MITVITNHPLALDSDDHLHPDGVHLDNHCSPEFVQSVENYFAGHPVNILDLGCAGGAFVATMIARGHTAVGLEGSDHCMKLDPAVIAKLGGLPLGHVNWQLHGNRNLFTCDVSYDYEIQSQGRLMQFDLITCFDVMEHLYPERIDKFLDMVVKHLKPQGLFAANIALFHLIKHKILDQGVVDYHKSLFSTEQWNQMLAPKLRAVPYPFQGTYRGPLDHSGELSMIYTGQLP